MTDEALAKIFKALSNEQRLGIFRMLCTWQEESPNGAIQAPDAGVEKCFTRACCSISLSRSTISHHFKELQNAGLISLKRAGKVVTCSVRPDAVRAIRDFLGTHCPGC